MKHLDLFSKKILSIGLAIGIIFSSIALFLFSLSTVSKSFAAIPQEKSILQTRVIVSGYTIVGVAKEQDGKIYAVGFDNTQLTNNKIKLFR